MANGDSVLGNIASALGNNPDLQELRHIWTEMYGESRELENEKRHLLREMSDLLAVGLREYKAEEEVQLKKCRVLRVREEIGELWDKCRLSHEERMAFKPFLSTDYSDILLAVHQEEVERLRQYHADNRELLELVDCYLELHGRYLRLAAEVGNPLRLFENRGGRLLRDERDRKAARRELPRLKRRITRLAEGHHPPFTVDGLTLDQLFERHEKTQHKSQ